MSAFLYITVFSTFSRVQLFGRFPSKEEENSYNLSGNCPAFLPADNLKPDWFNETMVENIKLNWYKYCILECKSANLYIFSATGCYLALIHICDFIFH